MTGTAAEHRRLAEHRWLTRARSNPVVFDTDTDNEIDDHFAVAWALAGDDGLDLSAVYAAPFRNDRASDAAAGMRQSHRQIQKLITASGRTDVASHPGSPGYLRDTTELCPAAVTDLITRARTGPVTVLATGAVTNIALALRADPSIAPTLSIAWLGGQPVESYDDAEFNFSSDPEATATVLGSGADLLIVPCRGVAELLQTTAAELDAHLPAPDPLARHLLDIYADQIDPRPGSGRPIWDMAATAALLTPEALVVRDAELPGVTADGRWDRTRASGPATVVRWMDRSMIFRDFFSRLRR